ncbi:axin-2 isoform X2 [Ranitomeya variabilis]|uniref:axin-2 isoform X2 n=1 Tax=Ranitomeya variabilis TaxID=490064 RepID=UPI004057922A
MTPPLRLINIPSSHIATALLSTSVGDVTDRTRRPEEREECETPICFQTPCEPLTSNHQHMILGSCDYDDPQALLDDHLSRVLKTRCHSPPGLGRSRSRVRPAVLGVQSVSCPLLAKNFFTKKMTKHVHHHYIHHHRTAPRSTEEVEAEAARRVQCLCIGPADYCCYLRTRPRCRGVDNAGRTVISEHPGDGGVEPPTALYPLSVDQFLPTVWQRMAACENKRPSKHSAQNIRSNVICETARASSAESPARQHQWSAPTRAQQMPPGLARTQHCCPSAHWLSWRRPAGGWRRRQDQKPDKKNHKSCRAPPVLRPLSSRSPTSSAGRRSRTGACCGRTA